MSQEDNFFEATIVESWDGSEHTIITTEPTFTITSHQFEALGRVLPSLRLVSIFIRDNSGLAVKRYEFPNNNDPDRPHYGGHYQPDRDENSWLGTIGHITMTEYDATNKKAKGEFEFTAVSNTDPNKKVSVKGHFNLGNSAKAS